MAISFLQKPSCDVLGENDGAIYLYDNYSDIAVLYAQSFKDGVELLNAVKRPQLLVVNSSLMLDYLRDIWHFTYKKPCFQAVYTKGRISYKNELDISLASDEELDIMMQTYEFASLNELGEARQRGMLFAAHKGGKFVGYIGEHAEGSMGMLHILKPYRGLGYATMLESFLIDKKLNNGQIPYCHIIEDNIASYNLQKQLGLEFAKDKIYWTRKFD